MRPGAAEDRSQLQVRGFGRDAHMERRTSRHASAKTQDSEGTLLYKSGDPLNHGVFLVLVGIVASLHVHAEEAAERLPEAGPEGSEERLDYIERRLVGLAVDQLQKNLALPFGESLHHGLVLVEDVFFEVLEVAFAFFLVWNGLDVFVRLAKGLKGKLGVGQRAPDVADGAPIEFLLLLVLELQGRIYVDVAQERHAHRVAIFVHETVISDDGLYGYLRRRSGPGKRRLCGRCRRQHDGCRYNYGERCFLQGCLCRISGRIRASFQGSESPVKFRMKFQPHS